MRIAYVHNMRFPTEKAHGYQIAKMCEAFADNGYDVQLIIPNRRTDIKETAFEYYGVKNIFKVTRLNIIDALAWHWMPRTPAFAIDSASFFIRCCLTPLSKDAVVYTRTPELAWLFAWRGYHTVFECHQLPEKFTSIYATMLRRTALIVAITHGLKSELAVEFKIPENKILVAPDGVDLKTFDIQINRDEAKRKLGLPLDRKAVVYTGQLIVWKGVDTMALAVDKLGADVDAYFVGGTPESIADFRGKYQNPRFTNIPNVSRDTVALWLKAADVLVMPNTAKDAISARHTSPLKLFEYMASGTPIVASDLPSVREILDERIAYFFKADDALSLAAVIKTALDDRYAALKSENAKNAVNDYTWTKRAINIIDSFDAQLKHRIIS